MVFFNRAISRVPINAPLAVFALEFKLLELLKEPSAGTNWFPALDSSIAFKEEKLIATPTAIKKTDPERAKERNFKAFTQLFFCDDTKHFRRYPLALAPQLMSCNY